MDAGTKAAKQRLSVLDLVARLGNAAEACRRRGMDRTSFYEWKRRFQTHGFDGLKDLSPIHRSHPQTTPAETVERILALALEHPAYGCNRIEAVLMREGKRVSAITVQKILNDHELGTREQRWLASGAQERRAGDRTDRRTDRVPGKAEPMLPRAPCREQPARRAALPEPAPAKAGDTSSWAT